MSKDEKEYNVTVVPKTEATPAEVAGNTAAAATPAVTSVVPAAAAPSVDIQRLEDARMDRAERAEQAKDARDERKEKATDDREERKVQAATESDIRNKDFHKTVLVIIVGALVTMVTTLGAAWFTAQNVNAVDKKIQDVKATGEKTFHYVNSQTLANLKTSERSARRLYMLTNEPEDKKDWEDAQRLVDEHEEADKKIQADKEIKNE